MSHLRSTCLPFTLSALLLLGTSCASALKLPADVCRELSQNYEGKAAFLKSSVHVLPFFSDGTRLLVSQHPPDSIELILSPSGEPILPGEAIDLLPLGRRVLIDKVEFPTSLVVTRRPLYSPREMIWVYFSLPEHRAAVPYVAVLRPGIQTKEGFIAALSQLFAFEAPPDSLAPYGAEVQAAVLAKQVIQGMDAAAVVLAWGRPEIIQVQWAKDVKVETWRWPLGRRTATFKNGILTEAKPSQSASEVHSP